MQAGLINNLSSLPLGTNELFRHSNVKGLRNFGNQGVDKFVAFNLKLSHQNCPLLQDYGIRPFLFANCSLAPNSAVTCEDDSNLAQKYINGKLQESQRPPCSGLMNHTRGSIGLGASLHLPYAAIECYLNLKVQHQKLETSSNVSINFGID